MMKVLTTVAIAISALMLTAGTANASKRCSGSQAFTTRGDYYVKLDRYRSLAPDEHGGEQQMFCSSVRYVARFLKHKIKRQSDWPHISGPFFDGYVTWYCHRLPRHRWECDEYDSGTAFSFRGRVW